MAYMASSLAARSLNVDGILHHNIHILHDSTPKHPRSKILILQGNLRCKIKFSLPIKIPGKSFVGQTGYSLRKKTNLVVLAGWSLGDGPLERPPYDSYIDSNTGEPVPARGARPSIPDKDFWTDDTTFHTRSGQAPSPPDKSVSTSKPSYGRNPGSRRKFRGNAAIPESAAGETVDTESTPEHSSYSSEEEEGDTSIPHVIHKPITDEEKSDVEELGRKYGDPHPFVRPRLEKKSPPLLNEELWWNWQKPPIGMERWSTWKTRAPDSDTAMAMAMAETGQIEIFGEKPTIAEASLARARKKVFKEERLRAEEERKKELGPMAYYQEWVKAWKKDTSKEAVQKHFEETGEDVHKQLVNMFQCQTAREYRIMMGTDLRICRDPLTMRMRPELKKAVFGGDPVYPTINYEQDPDCTVDYRGPNFHEPIASPLDIMRQKGMIMSKEEAEAKAAEQKSKQNQYEKNENDMLDEAMAEAIDIGEMNEEDENMDRVAEDEKPDWISANSYQSSQDEDKDKDWVEEYEKSDLRNADSQQYSQEAGSE